MRRLGVFLRWFWFRPVSPTNLGVSRILFYGILLVYYWNMDTGQWARVPEVFWDPIGPFAAFSLPIFSEATLRILDATWKAALAFACVGLFTRPSTLVAALLGFYLLGLPHNFGKVHHNDAIVVLALAVLAISHCGRAWSLDRVIRRRTSGASADPADSPEFRWPLQLIRVLFVLVFLGAGLSKLRRTGLEWVFSDSMSHSLVGHHYSHRPLTDVGLAIARHGWLTRSIAAGSVLLELAAPLALFHRKFRWVIIPALFGMQAGILVMMGVPFVQFSALYVFWVPYDRLLAGIKGRAGPVPNDDGRSHVGPHPDLTRVAAPAKRPVRRGTRTSRAHPRQGA